MNGTGRVGAALAVSVAIAFAGAGSAEAKAPPLKRLAAHGQHKTLTKAEIIYLNHHPKVATLVPDARNTQTGTAAAAVPTAVKQQAKSALAANRTRCKGTDRYQIDKDYLHQIMYKFHSIVWWCWAGTKTNVKKSYPRFTDLDLSVNEHKAQNRGATRINRSTVRVDHTGSVRLCIPVKVICYATITLHNRVTVKNKPGSRFQHWDN